jgi:putative transcriptional regulator
MENNKNELLVNLANNIKNQRIKRNLTQEQLASICGFDRTYISMLERAKRNPSYLNLYKIAKGLEIHIKELV